MQVEGFESLPGAPDTISTKSTQRIAGLKSILDFKLSIS